MESASDIRKHFLDYFQNAGHTIVPSSPLVPHNDPTLMFTNAGMNQFKNVFTGLETRDYNRATSCQKVVRAGGKHNDLENVGHTARHHTFFEMLGNFSFGDYFKEQAIELAWNLITKDYGLDKNRLLVTVYAEDEDAAGFWKKIAGLSDDKIIRIATSDNFWSMGEIGPCGPCTEIFYDHGDHIAGGPPGTPEEDGDRFVEIWNLVFMQYEKTAEGRIDLPNPCVDTGMGLERITAVMQGVHDNYDIDLFQALIRASEEATGVGSEGDHGVSHRVISDHLRSSCFLIADGVTPSNEGRGYVLRRIMRRAMRHAHLLGCKDPLMWRLVPALIGKMGGAYSELVRAEALMTEILKLEEERFQRTLGRGLRLLSEEVTKIGDGDKLSGDVAFKLYDTYGFPLDLTEDVLKNQDIAVDTDGFDTAMEKQRAAARASWSGSGEKAEDRIWFDMQDELGATEFLGYESTHTEGQIIAIIKEGAKVDKISAGDQAMIVCNQTPFYAESGGQMGDHGSLSTANGAQFVVSDTAKKVGKLHAHIGTLQAGSLSVGDAVVQDVNVDRRDKLRANHSATHLIHAALRKHIGEHVVQKGSLVAEDRLRFDFSHTKPLTRTEIQLLENEVNKHVRGNSAVGTRLMTPDEAQEAGALALFGEKYDDEVRVVSMGSEEYSIELCGGTHVRRTGDIGYFKIISEAGVAAGIRRIEAFTGAAAEEYSATMEQNLRDLAAQLKVSPQQVGDRVASLVQERKKLEKALSVAKQGGQGATAAAVKDIAGVKFVHQALEDVPAKDLRGIVDTKKKEIGSGVVLATTVSEGKVSLAVGVTQDITDRVSAVDIARQAAETLGG
ncbi:MAG: alanine--tRNA ligase, partial [Alphaproteobacteria bacterium]